MESCGLRRPNSCTRRTSPHVRVSTGYRFTRPIRRFARVIRLLFVILIAALSVATLSVRSRCRESIHRNPKAKIHPWTLGASYQWWHGLASSSIQMDFGRLASWQNVAKLRPLDRYCYRWEPQLCAAFFFNGRIWGPNNSPCFYAPPWTLVSTDTIGRLSNVKIGSEC